MALIASGINPLTPTAVFFPFGLPVFSLFWGWVGILFVYPSISHCGWSEGPHILSRPERGHNGIYALSLLEQKLASIYYLPNLNPQLTPTLSQVLCVFRTSLSSHRS